MNGSPKIIFRSTQKFWPTWPVRQVWANFGEKIDEIKKKN
jgi:hypothetical protein